MPEKPRSESKTQNRVIQLFTGPGGMDYGYLSEWNNWEKNPALNKAMTHELLTSRTRLPVQ